MWKILRVDVNVHLFFTRQIPVFTKNWDKQSTNASTVGRNSFYLYGWVLPLSQPVSAWGFCTFSQPIAINVHWDNVHRAQGAFHGCDNGSTDQYNKKIPIFILVILWSYLLCIFLFPQVDKLCNISYCTAHCHGNSHGT